MPLLVNDMVKCMAMTASTWEEIGKSHGSREGQVSKRQTLERSSVWLQKLPRILSVALKKVPVYEENDFPKKDRG